MSMIGTESSSSADCRSNFHNSESKEWRGAAGKMWSEQSNSTTLSPIAWTELIDDFDRCSNVAARRRHASLYWPQAVRS